MSATVGPLSILNPERNNCSACWQGSRAAVIVLVRSLSWIPTLCNQSSSSARLRSGSVRQSLRSHSYWAKFRLMRTQTWLWLQSIKEGVMSPKCSLANIKHNPVCLWSLLRVWNQAHQAAAASLAEPTAARIHSQCILVCEQMSLFVLLCVMIHCLCAGFEFGHVSRCI